MKRLSTFKRGQRRIILRTAMAALTLAVLVPLIGASAANANGVPLAKGDVLAGVGNGIIKHFDANGTLLDELNNSTGSTFNTGMCFDSKTNLYATNFNFGMSKFDEGGNLLVASFGSGFNADPESCVIDGADNIYVGQADGSHEVLKFNTSGESLGSFAPETGPRGTDFVDLASDGCTLHYTSEGNEIKRYDVCTKAQLSAFATGLPGGACYAHRILPDGTELVACEADVVHLNAAGEVINTYSPGGSTLFALNLDPDGTSFWTGDLFSGEIWRISIASGEVLKTFNAGINTALGGLSVVGEITQAPKIELAPATAENPVGTSHTVTATVTEGGKPAQGKTVTFTVTGANPQTGTGTSNANGEATFTYTGKNKGEDTIVASFVDKAGNTVTSNSVTKTWTEPIKVAAPLSPGYWKNHLSSGSPNTQQFLPQKIGSYTVTTTSQARAIFKAMTCSNASTQNAIGCLAGQDLAAELNLANGSNTCIKPAVERANAWLSGTTEDGVPGVTYAGPSVTYSLTKAQRKEAISLTTPLSKYNSGEGC